MTPSLEGWPTKTKEAPSPHEVRLTPLDTNPVFFVSGKIGIQLGEILSKMLAANLIANHLDWKSPAASELMILQLKVFHVCQQAT